VRALRPRHARGTLSASRASTHPGATLPPPAVADAPSSSPGCAAAPRMMRGRRASRAALAALLALGAACAGPAVDASSSAVRVWLTTGDRATLLARQPDVALTRAPPPTPATIVVDERTRYQAMVGFGAALTDASAWLIQTRMTGAQREALLQELFGRSGDGLGLGFVRVTMGASDFSRSHYSYDDLPPGETDPTLARFSIAPDRAEKLPVLRRALAINPRLTVMATPWSAPAWMKSGGSLIGGTLRPEAYGPFALYFRRFIEAYAAEGVPVHYLSVQNEPHHEAADYPAMRLDPAARARFVGEHLGPLLASAGLETRILDWDHNWDQPASPLAVLADPAARRYVAGVAWHCYAGEVSAQSVVHDAHPRTDTFFTECSGGGWAPDFGDNLTWNVRTLIIGATRHWARGVLLWNLALDERGGPHLGGCDDCRGVVTIDAASGAVVRNVEYYALGHVSRFVRPGAHRIASTTDVQGLESVAFRNADGVKALVVLNAAAAARTFAVRTDGRGWRHTLPAGSVATFVWR